MKIKRVILYLDAANEWRYRAQARNGRIVASSEEGFTRRAYAMQRIGEQYPGVEVVTEELD